MPTPRQVAPEPVLSSAKLQSYYYLRNLETREAKRRILMNLNFSRSVERTISKMAERFKQAPSVTEIDRIAAEYDNYELTDDGVPLVRDVYGVNIMHEHALGDMEALQGALLKIGTHYMSVARTRQTEVTGDTTLLYFDPVGVLAELYSCEASYQEAKRALVAKYFEAMQHVSDPAQFRTFADLLTQLMRARPRLDMNADYFTEAYAAETVCTNMHAELLKLMIADQVEKERVYARPFADAETSGCSFVPDFPCPGEAVQLVPEGVAIGVFDMYASLAILAKLPTVLYGAAARIKYNFSTLDFTARLSSSLDLAIIQEALVEWQLLMQMDAVVRCAI